MINTLNAAELRHWAMQCMAQANNHETSGAERDRLLKMQISLLALAENAEWLAGKICDPAPDRLPHPATVAAQSHDQQ